MLKLIVAGNTIMRMSKAHLPFHTPNKSGNKPWRIIDESNDKVVDSYSPKKPRKSKPIVTFKGSWADQISRNN